MPMQELGIALRDGEKAAHGGGAYLTERRLDALPHGVAARTHATDVGIRTRSRHPIAVRHPAVPATVAAAAAATAAATAAAARRHAAPVVGLDLSPPR